MCVGVSLSLALWTKITAVLIIPAALLVQPALNHAATPFTKHPHRHHGRAFSSLPLSAIASEVSVACLVMGATYIPWLLW